MVAMERLNPKRKAKLTWPSKGSASVVRNPLSLLSSLSEERGGFTLRGHLEFIARQVKANQDAAYLITGRPGKGKSTLARHMAVALSKIQDLDFSVKPVAPEGGGGNVAYPGQCVDCISRGMEYLPKGSSLITEEAMKTYFARNSGRVSQKTGITNLAMSRYQCIIQFYLLPKRRYGDVFLREDRSEYLINVWSVRQHDENGKLWEELGYATFYHADLNPNPFEPSPWFNEDATFRFGDPKNDPMRLEYEYYKDMFTRCSKLGYEAPWTQFPWREGAKPVPLEALLEAAKEEIIGIVSDDEQKERQKPRQDGPPPKSPDDVEL